MQKKIFLDFKIHVFIAVFLTCHIEIMEFLLYFARTRGQLIAKRTKRRFHRGVSSLHCSTVDAYSRRKQRRQ